MALEIKKYFAGHETTCPPEHVDNAVKLLDIVNKLERALGQTFRMTSGYRTAEHNKSIGGSLNSAHLTGEAIDIADADGYIKMNMRANNCSNLIKWGLYMEDGSVAKSWCHLTTRAPHSGKREFMP